MKLHKLPQHPSADMHLAGQTAYLAEKYLGKQQRFGSNYGYPPRGELNTLQLQQEFDAEALKGGHGVPLTSLSCPPLAPLTARLPQRPILFRDHPGLAAPDVQGHPRHGLVQPLGALHPLLLDRLLPPHKV